MYEVQVVVADMGKAVELYVARVRIWLWRKVRDRLEMTKNQWAYEVVAILAFREDSRKMVAKDLENDAEAPRYDVTELERQKKYRMRLRYFENVAK